MIYLVEPGFKPKDINPYTGKKYTEEWILFSLVHEGNFRIMNGKGKTGVYTLRINRSQYKYWQLSVMDFIEYGNFYNKNIILSLTKKELREAEEVYGNHHYNESCLRVNEPKVIVHSTSMENWYKIKESGCLKSWNLLNYEKTEGFEEPIGRLLGDPSDFSDYIMFSDGSTAGEIVVMSKENGKLIMDEDMTYKTGVRLYFDGLKIAEDGLLIRDGCHIKV